MELDAIPPQQLRDLVEDAINQPLPQEQLSVLQEAERNERELLSGLVDRIGRAA